ncbi:hypothetical protein [Kushneria phosphatilytica]|nr:hypothetical protein [Kushneria phosphatilytica]OHV12714.1 hypothetical protein BH688_01270 [Kushneria phosphatilytica]
MTDAARWLMQSVYRGMAVAFLTALIPWTFWIGAAISSLFTLRRGLSAALPVVIAVALPSAWWWWQGDRVPLASVTLTTVMAVMLRTRVRWGEALIAGTALTALLIQSGLFTPQDAMRIIGEVRSSAPQVDQLLSEYAARGVPIDRLSALMLAAVNGWMALFAGIGCLILARSWQAKLYNPGGFREEFHQFRLSGRDLLLLLGVSLLCALVNLPAPALVAWVPLLIAGFALVHGLIGMRSLSVFWLVGFYVVLVTTWPTLVILLLLLALMDTLVDFRGRLAGSQH